VWVIRIAENYSVQANQQDVDMIKLTMSIKDNSDALCHYFNSYLTMCRSLEIMFVKKKGDSLSVSKTPGSVYADKLVGHWEYVTDLISEPRPVW
jgi:hypothetical protein